jgi:hypothetical protein
LEGIPMLPAVRFVSFAAPWIWLCGLALTWLATMMLLGDAPSYGAPDPKSVPFAAARPMLLGVFDVGIFASIAVLFVRVGTGRARSFLIAGWLLVAAVVLFDPGGAIAWLLD